MNVLEFILDGLEAELALERELGVRSVEIDRALLAVAVPPSPAQAARAPRTVQASRAAGPSPAAKAASPAPQPPRPAPEAPKAPPPAPRPSRGDVLDFAFLHDRPLSPRGGEMMSKIVAAMGRTAETAPIVCDLPVPKARVYVILGGKALAKFLPGAHGAPGQWISSPGGRDTLVTYSPEYILRFQTVTPAVQKMKSDMWRSLKGVLQRLKV